MSIAIPTFFRLRWQNFFLSTLPNFLGFSSYSLASPIAKAIIDFSRLFVAFLIVWFIVWSVTKVIKEFF